MAAPPPPNNADRLTASPARDGEATYAPCLSSLLPTEIEGLIVYALDPKDMFNLGQVSKACRHKVESLGGSIGYLINQGNTKLMRSDSKEALWFMWKNWPRSRPGRAYVDPSTGWNSVPMLEGTRDIKGEQRSTPTKEEKILIDNLVAELVADELFLGARKIVMHDIYEETNRVLREQQLIPRKDRSTRQMELRKGGLGHPAGVYRYFGTRESPPDNGFLYMSLGGTSTENMDKRIPNAAVLAGYRQREWVADGTRKVADPVTQIDIVLRHTSQDRLPVMLRVLKTAYNHSTTTVSTVEFSRLEVLNCPKIPDIMTSEESLFSIGFNTRTIKHVDTFRAGDGWESGPDDTGFEGFHMAEAAGTRKLAPASAPTAKNSGRHKGKGKAKTKAKAKKM
jgi:hypothetical protein